MAGLPTQEKDPPASRRVLYSAHSGAVELTLLADLFSTVWLARRIERVPSRLLPGRAPVPKIDGRLIKYRVKPGAIRISNARRDQRAATTNALSVQGSILLRHAGLGQRADNAAGCRTGSGAERGRSEPARSHHGSKSRNRQQAQAGKQTSCAANTGADAGALSGAFSAIVDTVAIPVELSCRCSTNYPNCSRRC